VELFYLLFWGREEGLLVILLLILIMLRKGVRQSSFVEKTQPKAGREDQSNPYRAKNITNPSTHDQQLSKELVRKPEDWQARIPAYRVTKTRFDKNPPRYFDYSPLKSRERSQLSPYKQEFEAYNFAHLQPAESFDRRKKGRSYFYKRNDDRREGTANDVSNVSTQNVATKPLPVVLQSQPTDESKEGAVEFTLEEMHY
jgi:hypothetical protein